MAARPLVDVALLLHFRWAQVTAMAVFAASSAALFGLREWKLRVHAVLELSFAVFSGWLAMNDAGIAMGEARRCRLSRCPGTRQPISQGQEAHRPVILVSDRPS